MADTGVEYPTASSTESVNPEFYYAWTTPSNIEADDAAYSYTTGTLFDAGTKSYRLLAQGFDFSAIPDGSTIDGIFVEIERYSNVDHTVKDYRVQLLDADGEPVGDNKKAVGDWPASATIKEYGGASDTWGATPTAAMVKDADFGVVVSAESTDNDAYCAIDFIRVTVYYTEPTGWSGGDIGEVPIADIAKISGVELANILKVSGVS